MSPTGKTNPRKRPAPTTLKSLGRYPLSCILSFLSETEGTSFLLTKRLFAFQLLPQFRITRRTTSDHAGLAVLPANSVRPNIAKNRHRFIISPVQDSTTLLARLNTRRLHQRLVDQRRQSSPPSDPCYAVGYTTTELAKLECTMGDTDKDSNNQQHQKCHVWRIPTTRPCLLRFLDPTTEQAPWTTLLVSYPRSGNTLVRSLLERVTGLVTGSDTDPSRRLSQELAHQHNLVGEGVMERVPLIKSHWPERSGYRPWKAQAAILVVRNPYDAMDSYWNLNATCSHTKTVTDAVYGQFSDTYETMIRNEIQIWLKFHHYWLSRQRDNICVVRFEDLVQHPRQEMRRILHFLGPSPAPAWEARLENVLGTGEHLEQLGSYRPRQLPQENQVQEPSQTTTPGNPRIGKSLRKGRYSKELLQYIQNCAQSSHAINYLKYFGYDMVEQGFPNCLGEFCHPENLQANINGNNNVLEINQGQVIRPLDCPFGRKFTFWRHSVTNRDREPLAIVE